MASESAAKAPTLPASRRARRRKRQERSRVQTDPHPAPQASPADAFELVIVRSARRKKTVGSKLLNWYTLEIRAPVDIPEEELQRITQDLARRTLESRAKMRSFSSDEALERRAQGLNREHFGGALRWRSIRFVSNQNSRFGSCSPGRGTIRISHRLAGVPDFVLDYVLMHEIAHLQEPNHSKAFWELVYRFPRTERARGYLMALSLEDDAVETEDAL